MSGVERYVAEARRQIDQAAAKWEGWSGPCSECRFARSGVVRLSCVHPAVQAAAFNRDDSYDRMRIATCDEQRDSRSLYGAVVCGPDGVLFERKKGVGDFLRFYFG